MRRIGWDPNTNLIALSSYFCLKIDLILIWKWKLSFQSIHMWKYLRIQVNDKYLASRFKRIMQEMLNMKNKEMEQSIVEREMNLFISLIKCKCAKRLIKKDVSGSYIDQFNKLETCLEELKFSILEQWHMFTYLQRLAEKRDNFRKCL